MARKKKTGNLKKGKRNKGEKKREWGRGKKMKVAVIGSGSVFFRLFLPFFCSFFLDHSGRRLKVVSFLILIGFCLPISQYQGRSARRRWRREGSLSPSSTPAEAPAAGCPREGTALFHGWFSIMYASVCVSVFFFFHEIWILGLCKIDKGRSWEMGRRWCSITGRRISL